MSSSGDSTVIFRRISQRFERSTIRDFARRLKDRVAGGREFCCLIAGDAELARLNREFRGKDGGTDVLSFPLGQPHGPIGDIAISAGRAVAQAREHQHTPEEEVSILMLHGVLHLLGMDHERDGGRMARAERRWRRNLGLPAGVIERVRT